MNRVYKFQFSIKTPRGRHKGAITIYSDDIRAGQKARVLLREHLGDEDDVCRLEEFYWESL